MSQNIAKSDRQRKGFTLIELMLSITIIGLLAGLSLPVYASFNNRNDLDLTAQNVAQELRRAETYARGAKTDSQWGVELQSGKATLFQGTTFATRNAAYDEPTTIPASVAAGGLKEVFFSKLSGLPTTTGNITLSLTSNSSESRTVSINAKGMVNY